VPRGLVDRRPAAASPLVRNTEDWGEMLKKLDERVRGLLRDFDLELE
jgi:hypothetical protein